MAVRILLVALGGAFGAVSRYLLGVWIATLTGLDFLVGTFVIIMGGSFLIGIVLGLATLGTLSTEARLFLAIGVLGGYTTVSTFAYETLELLADGTMMAFLVNALGQLGMGLGAVYLGLIVSRLLGDTR
jgi:CrcB protein